MVAAAGRIAMPEALAVLDHLDDPAAALDAAVLAGVVVETGDRLSAAHPLIGAAAVESLPPGRRAQLYRRLADASANPERYAHFAALAAGPGPDGAVADALDAAAAAAHARAGNAAAGQFAAQAVTFTPASEAAALVRRRIRAGELLYLAGDVEQSLEHLEALDIDRLATADLERALPLLVDMTDLVHGHGGGHRHRHARGRRRRSPIPAGARWCWRWPPMWSTASAAAGAPPRSRRSAAPRPPVAAADRRRCTVRSSTWSVAKVTAAEGLDTGPARPGRAAGGRPAGASAARHRRPAPRAVVLVHRGPGHRAGRAAAVHRPGQGCSATTGAVDLLVLPGDDRSSWPATSAAAAARPATEAAGRLVRLAAVPGISSRAASC